MKGSVVAATVLAGMFSILASRALAQDPFEIQVYDAEVLELGQGMAEVHVVSKPSATSASAGPQVLDPGLLHFSLEPQAGLGRHLETAVYVETSLWPDDTFHFAGAKVRLKWRLPFSDAWFLHLAINGEIGIADPATGEDRFAGELRPIVQIPLGRCRLFMNFNLGVPLGSNASAGPSFEPQGKFNCTVAADVAPGVEYYTVLGPVFDWLPVHLQTHYLFYTLDVYKWRRIEINLGVGEPLTRASGPWTLNANLGAVFP